MARKEAEDREFFTYSLIYSNKLAYLPGFFSIQVLLHDHSQITGLQGERAFLVTPHYHFHPLHRHLGIRRAITAESSPLHIGSSPTRTGNLWFPSATALVYGNSPPKSHEEDYLNQTFSKNLQKYLQMNSFLKLAALLKINFY